ncbi:hypothetical protein FGO68_gene4818 [Halteria grandinella]|uniref:Uncharacterized protein n=1 Tax=Halteria grandinella TaxID=5974 RepID=A0A8J8NSQ8_HALGN|nr:hypothetical protein FGO68_gene4818 [Halteria grandinella]
MSQVNPYSLNLSPSLAGSGLLVNLTQSLIWITSDANQDPWLFECQQNERVPINQGRFTNNNQIDTPSNITGMLQQINTIQTRARHVKTHKYLGKLMFEGLFIVRLKGNLRQPEDDREKMEAKWNKSMEGDITWPDGSIYEGRCGEIYYCGISGMCISQWMCGHGRLAKPTREQQYRILEQ